jgi:hypothetical protein
MKVQNLEAAEPPLVSRKTAWRLVLIMTTLLVLALIAVVWGFVRQARIALAAPPAASAQAQNAAATVTLAPGAKIISASTEGGKLVLQVSTKGGGAEVDIIDLGSGKLTAHIVTAPAQ